MLRENRGVILQGKEGKGEKGGGVGRGSVEAQGPEKASYCLRRAL